MGLGRIAPPDGAFYIYADVSDFTDNSLEFCQQLLRDTGVATAPGVDFDPSPKSSPLRMHAGWNVPTPFPQ